MQTTDGQTVTEIAQHLLDDEIHVWRLGYRRELGRAPLRALLAAYVGEPPQSLVLIDGEHGRPELAPPHGSLAFNWSHSGDRALLAIARGVAPGIDLERWRARTRALEIAQRFFCAEEAAALAMLDGAQLTSAFLDLWTAKEAVLKALGRGIAFGLERLRFAVPPAASRLLWLDEDDAAQWQLRRLPADGEFVATLAWRGAPRRIRTWTLAAAG
ncbi:4'-phosphopantetheinyl transferase superfamily protein [Rhodanobacter sp. MP7CTX1]|uniref:4'-phosphopantetheinyl transferase family protein n=1 Tax=Rhodanobacter sp. MP7CTX1 TaxID=2723084 RepID=UPI001622D94D|nr:4'-phosphopantetheinyl transferase superfamily protein [Rhodanobacter sp. MP7CTX1]MBB6187765.1 4'-phosphopantetheinyl transferase [Rhodanobacter sp. MP7CTX1]